MSTSKVRRREGRARVIEYRLPGGWTVLAGRSDADNEHLSLEVARPHDWWFHVRGMSGRDVILQSPAGVDPDRDTLQRAAAIAAHHSKARHGGVVAVSCTQARHVSKPRRGKLGTVAIRKEIVLKVRPAAAGEVLAGGAEPRQAQGHRDPSAPPASRHRILR